MKIARLGERFKVKLGEISVTISPLSGSQKIEMTSMVKQNKDGKLVVDKANQELYLVKHSVKAIEGLKDLDDKEYQIRTTEGSGVLTDECAEEVLSFLANTWFSVAVPQMMRGLFGEVINPLSGLAVEGVFVERIIPKDDEKK